jgi:hypothetical protein
MRAREALKECDLAAAPARPASDAAASSAKAILRHAPKDVGILTAEEIEAVVNERRCVPRDQEYQSQEGLMRACDCKLEASDWASHVDPAELEAFGDCCFPPR